MRDRDREAKAGVFPEILAQTLRPHGGAARSAKVLALALACLVVLAATAVTWGRGAYEDEGYEQIDRRGLEQIDRINEALHRAGRIFAWVGIVVLAIVGLKVISPARIYSSTEDRLLKRAVRSVDDLLKRIQTEVQVEASNGDAKKETHESGLLAGMAEVAQFSKAEQVPAYVLTVNDLMLDNIRTALKRLRNSREGDAARYQDYMFSVIKGIKIITEASVEADVASGLAVDIRDYFKDDRRYKAWHRLLSRFAKRGAHQEVAQTFLLFMRNLKEGRPLVVPKPAGSEEEATVASLEEAPEIPEVLSEETLLAVQQAAVREAGNLCSIVLTGKPLDQAHAWQGEFVRRQQQIRLRSEAQRMLGVFLSCERKSLQEITKIKMLPCRTWAHILYMLGVESQAQLHKRVEDKLLTIQEIIVLEKAFLQTLAKRESLKHVYGHGEDAELLIDVHLPELRRETLNLLRRSHQTELKHFDRATEALNDEETPQNNAVGKLIEHYVHQGHNPPGV